MEWQTLLLIIVGCFILTMLIQYQHVRLFQWLGKGIIHFAIGVVLLGLTNMALGALGWVIIPFNAATLVVAGVLGVPGVCALVAIKLIV